MEETTHNQLHSMVKSICILDMFVKAMNMEYLSNQLEEIQAKDSGRAGCCSWEDEHQAKEKHINQSKTWKMIRHQNCGD